MDGCIDCNARARQLGSCYSETFPVKAPNGAQVQLTLRLCLACGTRFQNREALRAYLRSRLPAYVTEVAAVHVS